MINRTNNAAYDEVANETLPPGGPGHWRKIADLGFMINSSNVGTSLVLVFDIYDICDDI